MNNKPAWSPVLDLRRQDGAKGGHRAIPERIPWRGGGLSTLAAMGIERRMTTTVRVRFDEADPDGHLRGSVYLRHAQDVAWLHSAAADFDRAWYEAHRLTWLVRAVALELRTPVGYGERLEVSTEVTGMRRVWARRLSEFRAPDGHGELHAAAEIDWVLTGWNGLPARVPRAILDLFGPALPSFDPARVRLPAPPPDRFAHTFAVRRSELDPLGHVNNAVYLDYLEESIALAGGHRQLATPRRRYELEFLQPAEADAQLVGEAWPEANIWFWRLMTPDGSELCRGRLSAA